jgi:hypothetical protein
VALLIGRWLIGSLPHDDSLCLRELTQQDTVSRADFTSRHLFQVDAQIRYNNIAQSPPSTSQREILFEIRKQYTGHCAVEGKSCAVALRGAPLSRTNLIEVLIRQGTDKLPLVLTFGMSWCSLSASSFVLRSLTRSLCVFPANFFTLSASCMAFVNTRRSQAPGEMAYPFPLDLLEALLGSCLSLITSTRYGRRVPATP